MVGNEDIGLRRINQFTVFYFCTDKENREKSFGPELRQLMCFMRRSFFWVKRKDDKITGYKDEKCQDENRSCYDSKDKFEKTKNDFHR